MPCQTHHLCSRYSCLLISKRFWLRRLGNHIVHLSSTMPFWLRGSFHSEALACELMKRLRQFGESNCQRFCWIHCYVAKQIDWWTASAWYGFQTQGVCICLCSKESYQMVASKNSIFLSLIHHRASDAKKRRISLIINVRWIKLMKISLCS